MSVEWVDPRPVVERAQRRVLDLAGHRDVTVAESVAESVEWVTITDPPPSVVPVGRSLWQRIPDWALAAGTIVLLVLLALPLVLS